MMKQIIKCSIILLLTAGLYTSCSETRKRATDELNQLNKEAEDLNTRVDDGLKELESLDSVVRTETNRIKKYDSLVKKGSSKIDSIAKEKAKAWEDLTRF